MITFSLVNARSVFSCRASVLGIFEVYISQGSAATHFGCGEMLYRKFSRECASEGIMTIR